MGNSFSIAFIGIAHYADGHHCDGDNDHKEEDEEDNVEYVRGGGESPWCRGLVTQGPAVRSQRQQIENLFIWMKIHGLPQTA